MRQLLEKRNKAVEEMRHIAANPEGEGGDLSEAQETRFHNLKVDLEKLEKRIERQQLVDDAERRAQGVPLTGGHDAAFELELRNYSLVRAIAARVPDLAGRVDCGFEIEVSQELQRRSGMQDKGFAIPMSIFREERSISTTTPAAGPGSNLISEQYLGGQYIDRLRANLVISRLGARVVSDLQGNPVVIPGLKDSAQSGFFAENQAIPSSEASFRQITMTPKYCGMLTEISYAMLLQASPDIEALVRDDFAKVMAETIDRVAIQGGGTNEPTGILANTSITKTAYTGTSAWNELQDFIGTMEDRDVNPESCAFLTNPGVVTYLRQAERTPETFIMENRNSLDGYTVARTTLCPAETLIFGDFSDLIIGYWDSFSILVNPYADSVYGKGNVLVRATLAMDLAVRHIESFGVLTAVKAA